MRTILLAAGAVALALSAGSSLSATRHHGASAAASPSQPIPYTQLAAYLKASPSQRARKDWWSGEASAATGANASATTSASPDAAPPTSSTSSPPSLGSGTAPPAAAPAPAPPPVATPPTSEVNPPTTNPTAPPK